MKLELLSLLILGSVFCYSQDVFNLNHGEPINLDGHITTEEWFDADSIEIIAPTSLPIKVYFKHDGINFLAAFVLHNMATNKYS